MTKEEVIRIAQGLITDFKCESDTVVDFCNTIIKALKAEPCDDAISRQTVLDLVVANHRELNGLNVVMYSPLYKDIKQLPSVTPQPKIGHWIYTLEDWNKWECSECGFTKRTDVHVNIGYKYCPKCGAKMESKEV